MTASSADMAVHPFRVPHSAEHSASNTTVTNTVTINETGSILTDETSARRLKSYRTGICIAIVVSMFISSLGVLILNHMQTGSPKPTSTSALPQKTDSTLPSTTIQSFATQSRTSEAITTSLTTHTMSSEVVPDTAIGYAFHVLQTKNVTYGGYNFLAVQVQLPSDGLSISENWCRDYQYLCESFYRRPTGCTGYPENAYSPYKDCRDEYNSDMSMTHGLLSCAPDKISDIANMAFPNVSTPARSTYNSFGFYRCKSEYCQTTTEASDLALPNMKGFWEFNETYVMYTVCH